MPVRLGARASLARSSYFKLTPRDLHRSFDVVRAIRISQGALVAILHHGPAVLAYFAVP
jgi:hypothetical protein